MITIAIVRFSPKGQMNAKEHKVLLRNSMPPFQKANGLHRKYFCAAVDGSTGIYEWQSKEHAEAFYNEQWRRTMQSITQEFSVEILKVRAILDNKAGSVDYQG